MPPCTETGAPANLACDSSDLAPEDKWIAQLDFHSFKADIRDLGKKLKDQQGPEDVRHLKKIVLWSNLCTGVGIASMCLPVWTMFPTILLSLGIYSRWTMIAHHTCHGGYDNCETTGRYNRFRFAVGSLWRRFCDWFDWMLPEAWNVEHNNLHHYRLGEIGDPDLV